jgi:uncharacterized phage protein gp47/JayE
MAELKIYTYDELLTRMLARVPPEIDKRQGSVIYDALSLEALELAQNYAELPDMVKLFYPDTATDNWLDRSVFQYGGINRREATNALRSATFKDRNNALMEIAVGSRFRINDITLITTEKKSIGKYYLKVEQKGTIGNSYSGTMLPITVINGLGSAILEDVIIPAQDREEDEAFRQRFFYLNSRPAFGGNIADYELETLDIDGVGDVVVFPIWNGDGTVKLTIGNVNHNQATPELVALVQNKFMPLTEPQLGTGLAPIGHYVTVDTSTDLKINVEAKIKVEDGYTLADLKTQIDSVIRNYIDNIPFKETLVYVARVTAAILNVPHVLDVPEIKLNGSVTNIVLQKTATNFQTPLTDDITLTEVI